MNTHYKNGILIHFFKQFYSFTFTKTRNNGVVFTHYPVAPGTNVDQTWFAKEETDR